MFGYHSLINTSEMSYMRTRTWNMRPVAESTHGDATKGLEAATAVRATLSTYSYCCSHDVERALTFHSPITHTIPEEHPG